MTKAEKTTQFIDYDFIEIGTSNFDTLVEQSTDDTYGISIDAVKYYVDCLPPKKHVTMLNVGISNKSGELDVYFIPEEIIVKHNLPDWFKGCNCIGDYHPLHKYHHVSHLCTIEKVKVITPAELFISNRVRGVKFLKIDTEGHDCIILKALFDFLCRCTVEFHPLQIKFETNEHSNVEEVDEIIHLYSQLGYLVKERGYDTIIAIMHDSRICTKKNIL